MKKYLSLILICISSLVYGQSVKNLEIKNGFKTFQFGQNINEFQNISKEVYSDLLEYTDDSHKDLFDFRWNKLFFAFCNDKLFAIEIDFDYASDYKYRMLLDSLEKVFGESQAMSMDGLSHNNFKRYNRWENENVYMYIRYLKDDYQRGKKCNTCDIQIEIGSKVIENNCLKSEF